MYPFYLYFYSPGPGVGKGKSVALSSESESSDGESEGEEGAFRSVFPRRVAIGIDQKTGGFHKSCAEFDDYC